MAQDRIRYLCQRLEEGASIARVIETARTVANNAKEMCDVTNVVDYYRVDSERMQELRKALDDLWDSAYIELPDDHG